MYYKQELNKLSIILILIALLSGEAASEDKSEPKIQWFQAHYVLMADGLCEFKPVISADWMQIAVDQINKFDVKHPTKTDLKKHTLDFSPGGTYIIYYPVPAEKYGLQNVFQRHFYYITDSVVREVQVRIQGTLSYWDNAHISDNYGSLVFDCQRDEYMGFILASATPLVIRKTTPPIKIIKKFEAVSNGCKKKFKFGVMIDLNIPDSQYLIASEMFVKKCSGPCEYLDLLKISCSEVKLIDLLSICDI